MKNKNKRDLEKYWAEQAAKKAKATKKKVGGQTDTDKSNAGKGAGSASTSE
ncbi:MAG TPA: hypothetical protein VFW31_08195 [Candidatus Angelobacter sp.]|nr:hypothetical protein [Candidatus Angelobacter sp.]